MRDQEIPVKRNFVKVVVHVEDCNDHAPAFLSARYEAGVSNDDPAGAEVVRVKALDKDAGSNADVSYSLISGEPLQNIYIYVCFFFSFIQLYTRDILYRGPPGAALQKPAASLLEGSRAQSPQGGGGFRKLNLLVSLVYCLRYIVSKTN